MSFADTLLKEQRRRRKGGFRAARRTKSAFSPPPLLLEKRIIELAFRRTLRKADNRSLVVYSAKKG